MYPQNQQGEGEFFRARLPRGREVFGWVDMALAGSRFRISGFDGKERVCRIPGAIKKDIWVKPGDLVIIEPWEIEPDLKGDIIFRYTRTQAENLKRRGIIKG